MSSKISQQNTPSRLFVNDLRHVNTQVKERGQLDPRFKDRSSAIRHYVRLGVIAEKRVDSANSLGDRIIKQHQQEVVTESLGPVKLTLDNLLTAVENLGNGQQQFFQSAAAQTEALERKIDAAVAQLSKHNEEVLSAILEDVKRTGQISEATLRNAIVIRSILYTMHIFYDRNQLHPDPNGKWDTVVFQINRIATDFAVKEMVELDPKFGEAVPARELTKQMFKLIKAASKGMIGNID